MSSVDKYIGSDGRRYSVDPARVAQVARKGVSGTFIKQVTINIGALGKKDLGLVFFATAADGASLGGGEGYYVWDGQYARKRHGDGMSASVTCTDGAAILTNPQLMRGCNFLRVTAAGAVAPGTITDIPILPDGYPGQPLTITNIGAQTITLTDAGTMALSNLTLVASTQALAAGKSFSFIFDETLEAGARWRQVTKLSS